MIKPKHIERAPGVAPHVLLSREDGQYNHFPITLLGGLLGASTDTNYAITDLVASGSRSHTWGANTLTETFDNGSGGVITRSTNSGLHLVTATDGAETSGVSVIATSANLAWSDGTNINSLFANKEGTTLSSVEENYFFGPGDGTLVPPDVVSETVKGVVVDNATGKMLLSAKAAGDTNYALNNLTADDNRTHTWAGFVLTENFVNGAQSMAFVRRSNTFDVQQTTSGGVFSNLQIGGGGVVAIVEDGSESSEMIQGPNNTSWGIFDATDSLEVSWSSAAGDGVEFNHSAGLYRLLNVPATTTETNVITYNTTTGKLEHRDFGMIREHAQFRQAADGVVVPVSGSALDDEFIIPAYMDGWLLEQYYVISEATGASDAMGFYIRYNGSDVTGDAITGGLIDWNPGAVGYGDRTRDVTSLSYVVSTGDRFGLKKISAGHVGSPQGLWWGLTFVKQ